MEAAIISIIQEISMHFLQTPADAVLGQQPQRQTACYMHLIIVILKNLLLS